MDRLNESKIILNYFMNYSELCIFLDCNAVIFSTFLVGVKNLVTFFFSNFCVNPLVYLKFFRVFALQHVKPFLPIRFFPFSADWGVGFVFCFLPVRLCC